MTNHWSDIANATCVIVWGANPSENHPACMAHINRARFPKQFFTGDRANKTPAELIVIDPRKSRTAIQADKFIRIRPGTDIALANGLTRFIMEWMKSPPATFLDGTAVPASVQTNYYAYLNQTGNGTFYTDGSDSTACVSASTVPGNAKYTDARFIVNGAGTDYERHRVLASEGLTAITGAPSNLTISDFPKKASAVVDGSFNPVTDTVYDKLWKHVNPYTLAVVADICGCSEDEIKYIGDAMIRHSRPSSTPANGTWTRTFKLSGTGAEPVWAYNVVVTAVENAVTNAPYNVSDLTVTAGTSSRALGSIARTGTSGIPTGTKVRVTYTGTADQAPNAGYRAMTMLYAMGITQHTCGSQNVKSFAVLQSLLGNMGRSGGGINALRGIHNVQGSTDMGVLYHLIPGYSGNPSTQVNALPATNNAFGKYMDGLWGNPLSGTDDQVAPAAAPFQPTNVRYRMNLSGALAGRNYDDAYNTNAMNLQQRGFYNMTLKFFGDYTSISGMPYVTPAEKDAKRLKVDACYSLWPKGNGDNHIRMFRKMIDGTTKAAIVWGQNPAVTEPNQSKVREGLGKVPLLVCVDMFETETAGIAREAGTVTYLLPASSHVEKAGSATNSGRCLQWRYQATLPQGNSKDDTELLLRFAKALDGAGAFSHIKSVWDTHGITYDTSVYKQLYQNPYGGFTGVAGTFNSVGGNADYVTVRPVVSDDLAVVTTAGAAPTAKKTIYTQAALTGSEWVAEKIFQEWAAGVGSGGTLWLYGEGYDSANRTTATGVGGAAPRLTGDYGVWEVANRAKARNRQDPYGNLNFHGWGYTWLVNRRVLYNNSEVAGDQNDFFMSPDSVSRIFAPAPLASLPGAGGGATLYAGVYNYARWYRTHLAPTSHAMQDWPLTAGGALPPKHAAPALPGRFPAHTEPYESPRADLAAAYGYNTTLSSAINAAGARNLVYSGTKTTADYPANQFPLVLTTIRCVEHFQGGPITRNNWWNVEAEPEPWIEISSFDARLYNIKDGDMVKVVTARTEDLVDNELPLYGEGFRARIGTGLAANQRVGQGVVAIPWHWGDKGLSTGSRANDLTIDAMDANTTIPEFKACMCRIEPIPNP